MVHITLFTVELWMHLGDILGGLLSSQQPIKAQFIHIISVLNDDDDDDAFIKVSKL